MGASSVPAAMDVQRNRQAGQSLRVGQERADQLLDPRQPAADRVVVDVEPSTRLCRIAGGNVCLQRIDQVGTVRPIVRRQWLDHRVAEGGELLERCLGERPDGERVEIQR